MAISNHLLEIKEYSDPGYLPLVDYGAWRVAVLNYIDELLPENITHMQRHDQTDEVFVLLAGSCVLFLGEGDDRIEHIYAQEMEPFKVYNVKKGCWHTHTLDPDGRVLIVENCNTGNANSPLIELSLTQRRELVELAELLSARRHAPLSP